MINWAFSKFKTVSSEDTSKKMKKKKQVTNWQRRSDKEFVLQNIYKELLQFSNKINNFNFLIDKKFE